MAASQTLAAYCLVFPGGGALAVVMGKSRILHTGPQSCNAFLQNGA
ncbi:MAG: hypothetical protein ACYS0E_00705 [Planctomycetota bacterium]|jgi:hypothetical protein